MRQGERERVRPGKEMEAVEGKGIGTDRRKREKGMEESELYGKGRERTDDILEGARKRMKRMRRESNIRKGNKDERRKEGNIPRKK